MSTAHELFIKDGGRRSWNQVIILKTAAGSLRAPVADEQTEGKKNCDAKIEMGERCGKYGGIDL